jgi:hypothetical protein
MPYPGRIPTKPKPNMRPPSQNPKKHDKFVLGIVNEVLDRVEKAINVPYSEFFKE